MIAPRAVVTGGAGFIGSTLVDALAERGWHVEVLDDLSTGSVENLAGALAAGTVLHRVDVRDAAVVDAVIGACRPHAVFHLAAQIDVRRSVTDPAADTRINVEGTVNVLEAARRADVGRVVFSSTGGALYGDADIVPSPEGTEIAPMSPYGQGKHAAEGLLALYRRLHGLSTATLRFANVYGPRQDPRGEGGVIALFCAAALDGEVPVVFGDGGQTRDFVFVADVVRALIAAAEADDEAVRSPLNVGTGRETSVTELLSTLRGLHPSWTIPARVEPLRAGEVRRSCLRATAAQTRLGWRAETLLSEGLLLTARWQRAIAEPPAFVADLAPAAPGVAIDAPLPHVSAPR